MSYITTAERIGREQGRREGQLEGAIAMLLEVRFGESGSALVPEIYQVHDVDILNAVLTKLKTATSIDEIRAVYAPAS